MTDLFSMGLGSPTAAPIHQVSQRLLLAGLRNLLLSTKPKSSLLPTLAIPNLGLQSLPRVRLRVQASDSQAAPPAQPPGGPVQGLLGPHLVLALCPGVRMAAPAQDLSDQSVGLRSCPVTQILLGGQSVVQAALGDLSQVVPGDLRAALVALGGL